MKFKVGDIVRQHWFKHGRYWYQPTGGTYDDALFEVITIIDRTNNMEKSNFIRVKPLNSLGVKFLEETDLNSLPLGDIGGPKGSTGVNEVFFELANGLERAIFTPKMSQSVKR